MSCACVWHHNSSKAREAQALGWDVQCLMEDQSLDTQKISASLGQPGHLRVVPTCLLGASELQTAFLKKCVHTYNLGVAAPSVLTHIDNTRDTRCLLVFHPCNISGRRCGWKCFQCANSPDLSISIMHHSEAVTRHSKSETESQI